MYCTLDQIRQILTKIRNLSPTALYNSVLGLHNFYREQISFWWRSKGQLEIHPLSISQLFAEHNDSFPCHYLTGGIRIKFGYPGSHRWSLPSTTYLELEKPIKKVGTNCRTIHKFEWRVLAPTHTYLLEYFPPLEIIKGMEITIHKRNYF